MPVRDILVEQGVLRRGASSWNGGWRMDGG